MSSKGPAPQEEAAQSAKASPDPRLSAVYLGRFGHKLQSTCDANLFVEDVLLPCHKIHLAAVSSGLSICTCSILHAAPPASDIRNQLAGVFAALFDSVDLSAQATLPLPNCSKAGAMVFLIWLYDNNRDLPLSSYILPPHIVVQELVPLCPEPLEQVQKQKIST